MLKKLIIGLIILVAVLWGALYIAVKVALPPSKVQELVKEHGSKALNREVMVEGASISVFPTLKVEVSNICLANAPGFSSEPMFHMGKVVLALDFMSIFKLSPVIKEIRLEGLDILYEVDKKGRTNLEGLGGEPKAKAEPAEEAKEPGELPTQIPGALAVKSFIIKDARVRYRDLNTGKVITLGNINQQVSVFVDKNLEDIQTKGELVISSISVLDDKLGLRKGNIRVSFSHDIGVNLAKQEITLGEMKFGLQDILIELKGKVNQFMTPTPGVDIKISSNDISMASLLKEVPAGLSPDIPKLTARGTARLEASVAGILDTAGLPKVKATVQLKDIGFGHKDLPAGLNDLNGFIDITESSVEIRDFGFLLDKHPVTVAVLVTDLLQVPVLQKLKINSSLDLGKLMTLADKFVGLPEGFQLTGFIQSNIEASGKLDPQNPMGIKANGRVALKNILLATKELPEKVGINGEVRINNDKIDESLNIKIADSDVHVQVGIVNYLAMALPELAKGSATKVHVGVYSKTLNLDQILPQGDTTAKVEVQEESAPMTAMPALPNVEVEMDIRLNNTVLLGLSMTDFVQKTSIKGGVAASTLQGQLYTGSFSQNLNVDLRDTLNTIIAMKLIIDKVEANDFISRLNDKLPAGNSIVKALAGADNTIYGKYSMDMDIKTNGLPHTFADNMTGLIYVNIHDGRLVGVKMVEGLNGVIGKIQEKVKVGKKVDMGEFSFSKLDATFEAKDGELQVKHLNIDQSPAGYLDLKGIIGFDTRLDLTLENRMSKPLSNSILGAQDKVQGAVAGAAGKLGAVAGAAASGLAIVPKDKDGNAIAYYTLKGTLADPQYGIDYVRMQNEASGNVKANTQAALDDVKKQAEALARQKAAEAKAKLDAQKAKAQAAVQQKADEAKAKLNAEKDKLEAQKKAAEEKARKEAEAQKKTASDEAKKKGKKALKGLGF